MLTALKVIEARVASELPALFDINALPNTLEVNSLGTKLKFEITKAGGSGGVYTYRCDTEFHKIPLVCYFVVQWTGSRRASTIFTTISIVRRDNGSSQRASTQPYRNKFKTKLDVLEQLGLGLNSLFKSLIRFDLEQEKGAIVKATKIAKKLGYDVFGAISAYEPAIELGYRGMLVVIRARNLRSATQTLQMLWTVYRLSPRQIVKQEAKRYDRKPDENYQPERLLFEREFEHYATEAKKAVDAFLDNDGNATARVASEEPRFSSIDSLPMTFKVYDEKFKQVDADDAYAEYKSAKYTVHLHAGITWTVSVSWKNKDDFRKHKRPSTITRMYGEEHTVEDLVDIVGLCIERIKE
jgi:hypothetical protein